MTERSRTGCRSFECPLHRLSVLIESTRPRATALVARSCNGLWRIPVVGLVHAGRISFCSTSANGEIARPLGLIYSRSFRLDGRSSLGRVAPCLVPHLLSDPRSLTSSLTNAGGSFAGEWSRTTGLESYVGCLASTNQQTYRTPQPGSWWNCTPIRPTLASSLGMR